MALFNIEEIREKENGIFISSCNSESSVDCNAVLPFSVNYVKKITNLP